MGTRSYEKVKAYIETKPSGFQFSASMIISSEGLGADTYSVSNILRQNFSPDKVKYLGRGMWVIV